jgi:Fe(3+) dicitrate transport protein
MKIKEMRVVMGLKPPLTVAAFLLGTAGSRENERALVGSGTYLDTSDIRDQNYDDINRVLRKAPGVYIREEDGFGLFPNISLRGVDHGRSAKLMLLEDGIPMAPAPYASPAAYYSPTAGRMSGI